ncbi:DUF2894 domain-containing protein [Mangrovimicrobium sediminis]|uniref:DUF2894 domain-containing protein n=1 Tax=Mangrovimicrobium sediminis TaxID=2562682 RepID=A0A4Z0M1Q0_9GAMM|nr:DUF2894 domain-containing protein [Haliea sp. SAOS-164]TGD73367.1 DUF2894 domain-containing protein [Haliea sp. SAOS-164]
MAEGPAGTQAQDVDPLAAQLPEGAQPSTALQLPAALPQVAELALDEALQALRTVGAGRFDAARFAYLEALVARAQAAQGELASWFEQRAREALGRYTEQAEQAREDWASRARELFDAVPALAPAINAALADWDGRALARLEHSCRQQPAPGPLLALVTQIEALHADSPLDEGGSSLEGDLRQQERAVLAEFGAGLASPELRSARSYRQRMQRSGAQRLLAQSVAEAPQESGPLNPQKLVTRALASMQELSPQCSARYVTWLNTLLYLEQLGDN